MNNSQIEISVIIKSLAKSKKVSVKQLLEDCKINKGFIYDLEHKSIYPSIFKDFVQSTKKLHYFW